MLKKFPRLFLIVLIGFSVVSCAIGRKWMSSSSVIEEAPSKKTPSYMVEKGYQINNVWYYPSEDYQFDETGIASTYVGGAHGKYTSNGETYNENEVSAAHRTLPLPSLVRVTNLENGRMITVRINDRGPFHHGRLLSLSKRAAELLEIATDEKVPVHVKILREESQELALRMKSIEASASLEAAPRVAVVKENLSSITQAKQTGKENDITKEKQAPAIVAQSSDFSTNLANQVIYQESFKTKQLFIQGGVFSKFEYARHLSDRLSLFGRATIVEVRKFRGLLFGVRIGPFASLEEADERLEQILVSGYPDAKIIVD